jgi:hypothetical protein
MKIHFVNRYSNSDKENSLPLNTMEDFNKVIEIFPQLEDSLYRSSDLRQIAKDMASYLNNGYMQAWISED